jgi:hypothetical protein
MDGSSVVALEDPTAVGAEPGIYPERRAALVDPTRAPRFESPSFRLLETATR